MSASQDEPGLGRVDAGDAWGRFFRFVVAGAVNTVFSIVVYQIALFAFSHPVAYAIAYVAGIALAYYAYARHVFRVPLSAGRLAAFVVFYLASLLAETLLNAAFIEWLGLHERIAIFATIAIMLPVNYFGSAKCLGRAQRPQGA